MKRTLGFYQPFCTLMLHGKLETRWVRKGRKPPFPLSEYRLYSTQKRCSQADLFDWCGPEIMENITTTISKDETRKLDGCGICDGTLFRVREMTKEDEAKAFVKFVGEKTVINKKGEHIVYTQWILEFENVVAITPYQFKEGKQGVGKLTEA